MARRVRVIETLIDDLDGTEQPEGTGRSYEFTWQGVDYQLDLSEDHGDQLDQMLEPILTAARRVGGRKAMPKRPQARRTMTAKEAAELQAANGSTRALTVGGDDAEDGDKRGRRHYGPIATVDENNLPTWKDMKENTRLLKEIRTWARSNGFPQQRDNGRLIEGVREAWNAAHPYRPAPDLMPGKTTIKKARQQRAAQDQQQIEQMSGTGVDNG